MDTNMINDMMAHRPGRKSTADEGNIYYILRAMNGLSMAELAPFLNSNANRIHRLEKNEDVKFKIVQAVSELFGVSMDDLARNNIAAVATARNIGLPSAGRNRHKIHALAHIDIGDLGEEIVAGIERELLAGTGYESRVSTKPSKNRRNGYDVISSTEDGVPKYIEVKTTTSADPDEPFFMTDAEYRKMKALMDAGAVYRLYRIYDLDRDTQEYKKIVYTAQEVLDQYEPTPETYRMMRKESVI